MELMKLDKIVVSEYSVSIILYMLVLKVAEHNYMFVHVGTWSCMLLFSEYCGC